MRKEVKEKIDEGLDLIFEKVAVPIGLDEMSDKKAYSTLSKGIVNLMVETNKYGLEDDEREYFAQASNKLIEGVARHFARKSLDSYEE